MQSTIGALIAQQRELAARVHGLGGIPAEVLGVGQSLLGFSAGEDAALEPLAPLLDPTVRAELIAEHQQLADDLELLDWLLRSTPGSPDVEVLTASLVTRMCQHVDRDARLLARAAAMLAA